MAIIATLIGVKTQADKLYLTVRFSENAENITTKDFAWNLSDVPTLTLADIKTVTDAYKSSLSVLRNRITWLKNQIGQEI